MGDLDGDEGDVEAAEGGKGAEGLHNSFLELVPVVVHVDSDFDGLEVGSVEDLLEDHLVPVDVGGEEDVEVGYGVVAWRSVRREGFGVEDEVYPHRVSFSSLGLAKMMAGLMYNSARSVKIHRVFTLSQRVKRDGYRSTSSAT